jgi:hypothetical protein
MDGIETTQHRIVGMSHLVGGVMSWTVGLRVPVRLQPIVWAILLTVSFVTHGGSMRAHGPSSHFVGEETDFILI